MDSLLSGADYNQLRAFVAVGECLSFSRAAEQLGVSPSALSQMLRGFEERIGVRLLNRTTRSVALTDAGENLLRRVRPAVSELGDAVGQVRRYRERPAGVVRIHAFRSAARTYVEPILPAFAEAYPDVVLNLTLDDEVVDVVAGGFDVAIRIGEVIEKDMVVAPLGKELRQLAVASPDYLALAWLSGAPARSRPASLHSMALARPRDALRLGVFRERILVRGRRRRSRDRQRQGDGHSPGAPRALGLRSRLRRP